MAKTISVGYTDTAIANAAAIKPTIPNINWAADYRVVDDGPTEAVITNITSPLGVPDKFRFAHNDITDIYRGTGIDPTLYYQTKRGTKFLVQLNSSAVVTDTDEAAYRAVLPVSAHLVVSVPNCELIDYNWVLTNLIYRMLGGLWTTLPTGSIEQNIPGLLRGAILPSTL